jgi:glucose/arabinose dehydrogenase
LLYIPNSLMQFGVAPHYSGLLFYAGDKFPAWKANLMVGSAIARRSSTRFWPRRKRSTSGVSL